MVSWSQGERQFQKAGDNQGIKYWVHYFEEIGERACCSGERRCLKFHKAGSQAVGTFVIHSSLCSFILPSNILQGCSHEIKRRLLLGRKVMTNLDSILKNRDIILSTKAMVKAMVFPVVMYECESWTIRKAECQCFWTVVLEKTLESLETLLRLSLRVPWTSRRPNQSILKEISPWYSLEGLMLELELQYRPPDAKDWFLRKDPDAGKDWRWEEKGKAEDEMVG